MKKQLLFSAFIANLIYSQVGINTGSTLDASAVLEIESNSKGLLLPRINSHTLVTNPTNGLIVYDIGDNCINIYANDSWIDLCSGLSIPSAGSGTLQCGSGYTTETVKAIESTTSQQGISLLVTESGKLMVAGRMAEQFEGMNGQFNYDFNVITGPWVSSSESVLYADLTTTSTSTRTYGVVATTGGLYYQMTNAANWTKSTSYTGGAITKVQTSRTGGTSVLDENGDVYYVSGQNSDAFAKISALDAITITDIVVGQAGATNYAWVEGSNILYYWTTDPNNVQSYNFTSPIVSVDSGGTPSTTVSTLIVLNDGSLYAHGGSVYFDVADNSATPTLLPITIAAGDRPLDADEKILKIGGSRLAYAYFVTDKGNVYSHASTATGVATGWYHEYEIKVSDPTTAYLSANANSHGVIAKFDGHIATWAASVNGSTTASSNIAATGNNTTPLGEGSGISVASSNPTITTTPVYVPICTSN